LDGSNSERARLIAQRVRTNDAVFLLSERLRCVFPGFCNGIRRAFMTVGGTDWLVQRKLFYRSFHPASS